MRLVLFFGYDRQDLMIAAFVALAVAGVVVSLGAWVLLWRYRRRRAREVPQEAGRP